MALQAIGGVAAVALWATFSHSATETMYAVSQEALTFGSVLYLPFTLGLPFLLANYARPGVPNGQSKFDFAISAPAAIAVAVAVLGVGLAILDGSSSTGGAAAVALAVSAVTCAAALTQQLARIRWSVAWMVLTLLGTVSVPAAWLLTAYLPRSSSHTASELVVLIVASVSIVMVIVAWRSRGRPGVRLSRTERCALLRVSMPMIPHLFAFGVLMQGPRLAAVLSSAANGAGPALIVQASYIVSVLGIGFTAIASIHGLVGASIQAAGDRGLSHTLERAAWAYATIGFLSSAGVATFILTPLRSIFAGFASVPLVTLALICAVPASLSSYYLQSSLMVRRSQTILLASITVPAAGLLMLGSLIVRPSVQALVGGYLIVMLILQVAVTFVNISRTDGAERRSIMRGSLATLVSFAPASLLLVAAGFELG